MNVSLSPSGMNPMMGAGRPGLRASGAGQRAQDERPGRFDSVTLSPAGKAGNVIASLTKQRQDILESRKQLIASAEASGGGLESVKAELESYDELLKTIDEQLAQAAAQQPEEQADKAGEKQDDQPKTREEMRNRRLGDVVELSAQVGRSETLAAVQKGVERQSRVLAAQIKMDRAANGASSKKEEELSQLRHRSDNLLSQMGDELLEVNREAGEKAEETRAPEAAQDDGGMQQAE